MRREKRVLKNSVINIFNLFLISSLFGTLVLMSGCAKSKDSASNASTETSSNMTDKIPNNDPPSSGSGFQSPQTPVTSLPVISNPVTSSPPVPGKQPNMQNPQTPAPVAITNGSSSNTSGSTSNSGSTITGLNSSAQSVNKNMPNNQLNNIISNPPACDGNMAYVTAVSAGSFHTCAVTDGRLKCWGSNSNGQLGNNSQTNSSKPVNVTTMDKDVTAVAAGLKHTCAIKNGEVYCWGDNTYGQLGDGSYPQISKKLTPVKINYTTGSSAVSIDAGDNHTCALYTHGGVVCWGSNSVGQSGNGSFSSVVSNPVIVLTNDQSYLSQIIAIDSTASHTCAIKANHEVYCWGLYYPALIGMQSTSSLKLATKMQTTGNLVNSIASGEQHSCLVYSDKTVKCWGFNPYGQLGLGEKVETKTKPEDVREFFGALISNATNVSAGRNHTCVLRENQIWCWGISSYGQIGTSLPSNNCKDSNKNYTSCAFYPMKVQSINSPVTAIASGENHNCAILDGCLKCWGRNLEGQLGNGYSGYSTAVPVSVAH